MIERHVRALVFPLVKQNDIKSDLINETLEYVDTNFMQGDLMYEESVGDTCVFKKI